MIPIKEISRKRFDVYVNFTRHPFIFEVGEEKRWYENDSRTLFGVILWDYTDNDYNAVLLGRDENYQVRAIDVNTSFSNILSAEEWLENKSKKLELSGQTYFAQGGEGNKGVDLFTPIVDKSRFHPYFDIVNTRPTHSAAKALISEIAPHFYDIDGNFVDQFQTQGFDSRLWELFLLCYFNEENLQIDRTNTAPDFMLSNGKIEVAVEAATVGRKTHPEPFDRNIEKKLKIDIKEELENIMPIRYGSPLYSKLKHTTKQLGLHYWEYPHTCGKPFVIAIADFHEDLSMTWSTSALQTYLYGFRYFHSYDDKGNLIIKPEEVKYHKNPNNGREIPSGYFFQPGTENISAILHTSSGTVSKFNRMGKQCGFDDNNTIMYRVVALHNHDQNASKPHYVNYAVTEQCEETWGEGISIYHNPNARYPLPKDFFIFAAQHILDNDIIVSLIPDIHVYSSFTLLFQTRKNDK